MNFLELCQETARLCEITGGGPVTIASATGENAQVVRWTRNSWTFIQGIHEWAFLRSRLSFNTVVDQAEYLPADMSAASIRRLDPETPRMYLASAGVVDEQHLVEWSEREYEDSHEFGLQIAGRPAVFAWRQATRSMLLGPKPGAVYTVAGWYWRQPVQLAGDNDEPAIDSSLHMIIPYRAAMMYANREAAQELKMEAIENYGHLLDQMMRLYLPEIGPGGPIA